MASDLTQGSTLKNIVRFSLPLLAGNLFQQTYNMVDASIVGHVLGPGPFGAVGASTSIVFLVLGFCTGLTTGFAIPVAQRFGARQMGEMRRYVFMGVVLTGILALAATLGCSLLCHPIMHMLSVPQDIYSDAYAYLLVIFLGIPFTLLYNLFSGILARTPDPD